MNEFEANDFLFWIRAKKATREHHSHRHMWKICVAYLKPIQFDPIELNYVYLYSCKSVQFAALHIPVAHITFILLFSFFLRFFLF